MTLDEARSVAVASARRIGAEEDPLYLEQRNFRTVVIFPHYVAWVAHDEQYGWGLRELSQHHRTGRTLEQNRGWALRAVEAAT